MEERYQEALSWLYSQLPMFSRIGAAAYKPGLDTSIKLDDYFGNPHKKFKSIHVAGTNGKGSVSHMLASSLQSMGYKTGLYTSPHLIDFRERIKINGKMISKDAVCEFVDKWKGCNYDGSPSFFELTMIMAFDYFAREKVDVAVIETGMGGRLDSTNIITPKLCVITNISKDHTQFLGDTLPKIATEKAGIIKEGIPVVIGEGGDDEVKEVFSRCAESLNAPIVFAEKKSREFNIKNKEGEIEVEFKGEKIALPLHGDYQEKNIATVLAAIDLFEIAGFKNDSAKIKEGLEKTVTLTGLQGRWQTLQENPLTIADTGHNEAGLTFNFKQLDKLKRKEGKKELRIVIGVVADKAIDDILKLLPKDAFYYVSNANIPRALPYNELLTLLHNAGFKAKGYKSVPEAYQAALSEADHDDIIFVGGSTFVVADLLAHLEKVREL